MRSIHRFITAVRRLVLPGAALAATVVNAGQGQDLKGPLVLKAQGSFFVGGQTKTSDALAGSPFPGLENTGDITIDQMYVQFQIPEGAEHVPVVMVHGCCLSSKTWETTPDGRMGWNEFFVRRGRAIYLADQVSRARSGFDATTINEVKLGMQAPSQLPSIFMASHQVSWAIFRFGPSFNVAFSDEQFPVQAVDGLYKQEIPDLNALLPAINPTWTNMAALAVRLKGAILMGHSESGFFPEQGALIDPSGIKGLISLEPGLCNSATLTPSQIAPLAKIPTLVVFGDHLADVPGFSATVWSAALSDCQQFVQAVNTAGGDATLLHLPDAGLFGNSHMFMQDKNNLQVADLILAWIGRHVENEPVMASRDR